MSQLRFSRFSACPPPQSILAGRRVAITYVGWRQQVWHWRPYNFGRRGRPPIHHTKVWRKLWSRGSTEAWETCGCGLYIYTGQQLLYTSSSPPQQHWPDEHISISKETFFYWQYDWLNKHPDPIILFFYYALPLWGFKVLNLLLFETNLTPDAVCNYTVLSCSYKLLISITAEGTCFSFALYIMKPSDGRRGLYPWMFSSAPWILIITAIITSPVFYRTTHITSI